ncbi:MAG: hypothetical protein IKI61_05250 [Erysipelotrichaceae bacterium]|nr:hypothetical protein [Erysipelotrichaceae bacterium]
MDLESCKKVLKRVGMMATVFSALGLIAGILLFLAFHFLLPNIPELAEDSVYLSQASAINSSSMGVIFENLFSMLGGIYCRLSSRNNKYLTLAWILSILNTVISSVRFLKLFLEVSIAPYEFLAIVISLTINVALFTACVMMRDALKNPPAEKSEEAES